MDKRDVSAVFRDRLAVLQKRARLTQSGFAAKIGIDRSALSQLSTGQNARLPRAETLLALAESCQVSVDWLLGLTADSGTGTETVETVELERSADAAGLSLMGQWHQEATGQKIRYVPVSLPDLLRTAEVMEYQAKQAGVAVTRYTEQTAQRLNYSRQPESDMELCMPCQTLVQFARGEGAWTDLPRDIRATQLAYIAETLDTLYPSFRMYLFDGQARYSLPYTLFGYARAAVFAGDMYLMFRTRGIIRELAQNFDAHIRAAQVQAHDASRWVRDLQRELR